MFCDDKPVLKPDTSMKKTRTAQRTQQARDTLPLLVQSLIRSGLFLQRELSQVCQHFGLNTNQFSVLNEIKLQGPLSQKELCERLLFEKSNLSKIVKNLQDRELIEITVAPEDRRMTLLIETEKGDQLIDECLRNISQSSTGLMAVLSNEEVLNSMKMLKKLEKSFRRIADK